MDIRYISQATLENLKDKNVFIYGAGAYAHDIKMALDEQGIGVAAFIIDNAYVAKVNNAAVKILSLSSYKGKETGDADIVINGIADVGVIRRIIKNNVFKNLLIYYEPTSLWKCDEQYCKMHKADLDEIKALYCDDKSRQTMNAFLKAKLTGDASDDLLIASEEKTYFNNLTYDCPAGAYIDCGAFDGDSVLQYIEFARENGKEVLEIWAFEPDEQNFAVLERKFKDFDNIHCVRKGIGDEAGKRYFNSLSSMGSNVAVADDSSIITIDMTYIDNILPSPKVGFIKMDIEGSEYEGLIGARNTILRDHPVLAISAYHRPDDLIRLPRLIKSFEDENWKYNLHLRHHGFCAYELVLYGIPEKR